MIKIENIKKQFKGNMILNDLSCNINDGELIRITGQNGCGKSTLLKIIVGLLKPDSGKVVIDTHDYNIGAVIENPSFIENETLCYNLKFLYNLKNVFSYEKVKELCDFFNLDINSKTPIKKFSLGMRQKVAIIQAVMENQNIILLDEPTRGLDDNSVRQFNKLIKQLHDEHKIVIICAHDGVDKIEFDRILEISNGKIS